MKQSVLFVIMTCVSLSLIAAPDNSQLQQEIKRLKAQTQQLQNQINHLEEQMVDAAPAKKSKTAIKHAAKTAKKTEKQTIAVTEPVRAFHTTGVTVNAFDGDPESLEFYPTALMADEHVVTFIAGTPIVSSPYLGSRPAFDGSDYIVNISSINRDIRLMQQRRRLYRAYKQIGYPVPDTPILAFSGKVEPVAMIGHPYIGEAAGDLTLGSSEIDLAAALNDKVEAYIGIAYNDGPSSVGGPRVNNGNLGLNMGFVNIGDLDQSPIYFTAGQLFVPFGRFSTSMVSAPITMRLARTKSRPFILGYKSQRDAGLFAALYGFKSDTTLGTSGVGGLNLGYIFDSHLVTTELGISFISSLNDAGGMQITGTSPGGTFGGFGSLLHGNENVRKIPGGGAHVNVSMDRYTLTAEWVGALDRFRTQDLSFNGHGAKPEAIQLEAGVTFMSFDKPSSLSAGYQWSSETLALNLPEHRISGVYNISIWKDTIESLEYRHDIDFNRNQFANGASPSGVVNANTVGTNGASDTVLLQIGVYF